MILNKIYGLPASVTLITQVRGWKYGKTDYGLLLCELTKELGLIKHFASNTETFPSGQSGQRVDKIHIEFINDFQNLDWFLEKNSSKKMYMFDEAIEATQKRRAMSSLNVEWVKRIPQLSKGKCHLVVITQETRLTESAFLNWTFLRGIWTKLSKKLVRFESRYIMSGKPILFGGIPKTNIKFNPFLLATFTRNATGIKSFKDEDKRILWDWVNGKSLTELGLHPQKINRLVRKYLKTVLEKEIIKV